MSHHDASSSRGRSASLRDEEIGELLHDAGRRPPIPATDLETIRIAARAAWRETAAAERRRRRLRRWAYAAAASIVLGLLAGAWWVAGRSPLTAREVATVALRTGPVRAIPPTESGSLPGAEIEVGDTIREGTLVVTEGDEASPSRVALDLAGGASIRLDGETRLRLVSRSRLELESGAVYVDSGATRSAGPERLEILVRRGVVREIGTQFMVELGEASGGLRVRVREGAVSLDRDGASHTAKRGEEITLAEDGTLARGAVDPDGPQWQWVLAAAPSIDIEGRSLGSYLEWVARETGWRVRWSDESLERSAARILLHGTIDGLRPDESLGVILEGSGLDHRIENGEVRIESH